MQKPNVRAFSPEKNIRTEQPEVMQKKNEELIVKILSSSKGAEKKKRPKRYTVENG